MAFKTLFRDGEQVTEGMFQRILGQSYYAVASTSGVGTGFANGVVGIMNGAAGADPNHFSVQADGTDLVLTVRGGWVFVVKDVGTTSFDPRTYMVESSGPINYTVPSNSSGTTRVDTICLRIDQSITPDATGSNLPSIYNVQGGASSALGNAPSDGALYYPLALVTIDNGETSLTSGDVADKRATTTSAVNPFLGQLNITGRPTSGTYTAGQVIIDINGMVCECITSGTPGGWRTSGGTYYGRAKVNGAQTIAQGAVTQGWNGQFDIDPFTIFANNASTNFIFQAPALGFTHQIWEFNAQVLWVNPGGSGSQQFSCQIMVPVGGGGTQYAIGTAGGAANPGFVQTQCSTIIDVGGTGSQIQMTLSNTDASHGNAVTQNDGRTTFFTAKLVGAHD